MYKEHGIPDTIVKYLDDLELDLVSSEDEKIADFLSIISWDQDSLGLDSLEETYKRELE